MNTTVKQEHDQYKALTLSLSESTAIYCEKIKKVKEQTSAELKKLEGITLMERFDISKMRLAIRAEMIEQFKEQTDAALNKLKAL
ncbi:hypothetical protein L4D00_15030 [Photobacterium swingsii]|uniref:hypothetical protein n=1 Tax=Photobacterium swingsii TaxID=680026 RepID=UPI003D0A3DA1